MWPVQTEVFIHCFPQTSVGYLGCVRGSCTDIRDSTRRGRRPQTLHNGGKEMPTLVGEPAEHICHIVFSLIGGHRMRFLMLSLTHTHTHTHNTITTLESCVRWCSLTVPKFVLIKDWSSGKANHILEWVVLDWRHDF